MSSATRRVAAALLFTLAAPLLATAPATADGGTRITVSDLDVSGYPLVRFVAAVTDAQGHAVKGLTASDLTVREAGILQPATIDLASRTGAIAIALVLDTSGSMAGRPLSDAKAAMSTLVRALGSADQVALITFDVNVKVDQALTTDKAAVLSAIDRATAGGNTAIYDALAAATDMLAKADPKRRAIILLTDGVDNSSRASATTVLAATAAAQLPTNVIALGNDIDRAALARIAGAVNGGQLIEAPTSARLDAIYAGLSEQLLTQYAVSYRSTVSRGAGSNVDVELRIVHDGSDLTSEHVTYRVPATAVPPATGAPVPSATPAPAVVLVPAPAARVPAEVIGLLGAAAVLTLLLWVSEIASTFPARQRRRLEVFVHSLSVTSPEHSKRRSIVQRVVVPTLRSAGRPFLRITPAGLVTSTRERLQAAGEPLGIGAAEFIGVRAAAALVLAILGLAILTPLAATPRAAPFGLLIGGMIGYVLPAVVIDRIASGRKTAIRRALPSALDMLALSAEAGLSFDGAIGQVAHRWDTPLSEELRRLLLEFQMGRDRRSALRELAARTGVPELSRFAAAVIQADSLGVPLSRVLHEQSAEIRIRRRQHAEEAAHKAPVKMLFPMLVLIFPALFVVVLGPALARLMQAMSSFGL